MAVLPDAQILNFFTTFTQICMDTLNHSVQFDMDVVANIR